jgi:hypothetical protein
LNVIDELGTAGHSVMILENEVPSPLAGEGQDGGKDIGKILLWPPHPSPLPPGERGYSLAGG